jgi:L-threonylcarbamoyladenylate synthase
VPVVTATSDNIDRAATLLRKGGVVAFPTETVYGLGANAFDPSAVARIFEIKGRPAFDPLIVHVLDGAMLERVAAEIPPPARALAEGFWPGPLTLVLPKRPNVPDLVTAGLPSVGIRMPAHPIARALLERTGTPLAAPSANPFGRLSPTRAEHVQRGLGNRVDLILDGGPSAVGLESTIVGFEPGPQLLRRGAIPAEELEAVVGPLGVRDDDPAGAPVAPGRLPRHYAPHTPIRVTSFADVPVSERVAAGALAFREAPAGYRAVRVLSPAGNLNEAAGCFFESLHELDAAGVTRIDAEPLPDWGLGAAMMERLRRATSSA